MTVKIKLEDEALLPSYAKKGDAGLDLTAIRMKVVDEKEYGYIEYDTGVSLEIPEGYVGLIFPRSSISNTGMLLSNSVGVIDSGYRGNIKFRFKYIPGTKTYEVGDRIGQLIIIPYPQVEFEQVEELTISERSNSGFGSTNKN